MPELMIALLIGASLASLIGSLYWEERKQPDRQPRKPNEGGASCVWCLFRRGDICIHPGSPVYPGECSPVCIGVKRCDVRRMKAQR
jgi:hypothetical protein